LFRFNQIKLGFLDRMILLSRLFQWVTTKEGKTRMDDEFPAILDRELSDAAKDAFGHHHFAKLLAGYVESQEPPYSIGLLGRWGVGKSTIKSLYEHDLTNRPSKDRIKTMTFNAWRYGGENVKRALLRHVYLGIGGDKTKLDDALFRQVQRPEEQQKPILQIIGEWVVNLIKSIIPLLIVLA
jgi:predicted KAP-like P-loop ATPase